MLQCSRLLARNSNFINYSSIFQRGYQLPCINLLNATSKRDSILRDEIHLRRNLLRHCSTGIIQSQDQNVGILKKALKKIGFAGNSKTRLKVTSFILYECVADGMNYVEFFDVFNMPNTFNSWFLVTELHVWMLLLRAMAEGSESGEDGRFLRNCIVEAMWADVNTRAKKLGANNPSGTRAQIEILSEQFQAALITYDEGIMSDDKVLAGALWRRFFERKCDDYFLLEGLVSYVRQQVKMLDSLDREKFIIKPKIQWIPLKDIVVEK